MMARHDSALFAAAAPADRAVRPVGATVFSCLPDAIDARGCTPRVVAAMRTWAELTGADLTDMATDDIASLVAREYAGGISQFRMDVDVWAPCGRHAADPDGDAVPLDPIRLVRPPSFSLPSSAVAIEPATLPMQQVIRRERR